MWIGSALVPLYFLGDQSNYSGSIDIGREYLVDIEITGDQITQVLPHRADRQIDLDLEGGIVLPCLVDCHTHLDKAHTWQRAPNPDGTFRGAIEALERDRQNWNANDLTRRMEFALECSYRHGTRAIRTHLDVPPSQLEITTAVFQDLQQKWQDRLELQAVSLISLDLFVGSYGELVADSFARMGGILGGVAYPNPDLESQIDRVFSLAKAYHLALDFHVDETDDPQSDCLRSVAEAVLRHQFPYPVTCGHCCSLANQAPQIAQTTLALVKAAEISIVSLPLCNLYLQDRRAGRTPRWRGVTLLKEAQAMGIPVAIAHDNCRDAFYPLGDHDLWQIFTMATLIGHLDYPQWLQSITTIPAQIMGLNPGLVAPGQKADLILFNGSTYNELLARPQTDRQVIRNGKFIECKSPSYRQLDKQF
jgi:cytosine deaminase